MMRGAARPAGRGVEAGLLCGAGLVLLLAMGQLGVALSGHVQQSAMLLLAITLAMMLAVNLILTARLPRADQVIFPVACMLAGLGLDETWLRDHPGNLTAVSVDDVATAAAAMLAPARFTGVVVGDLGVLETELLGLGNVSFA